MNMRPTAFREAMPERLRAVARKLQYTNYDEGRAKWLLQQSADVIEQLERERKLDGAWHSRGDYVLHLIIFVVVGLAGFVLGMLWRVLWG